MKEYIIKKDGKIIGKVKIDLKILLTLVGSLTAMSALTGCGSEPTPTVEENHMDYSDSEYLDQETVDLLNKLENTKSVSESFKIEKELEPDITREHVIEVEIDSYFNTVDDYIFKYISDDKNRTNYYRDRIMELNDLENVNSIRVGQTIKLPNVKEEYLEQFGYTMDYSKLPMEIEMQDRMEFLNEHQKIYTQILLDDSVENEIYRNETYELLSQIGELNIKYQTADESEYQNILDEARYICSQMSNKFEDYKPAHKLPELEEELIK